MNLRILIFSLTIGLVVGGCASHNQLPSEIKEEGLMNRPPESDSLKVESIAHRIESGDFLEINVYENPDLSAKIRVPEDGFIPFPLLGNLKVTGMTAIELDSMITQDLGEKYILNPQVTVVISEYRQRNIYVTGEVRKPGGYPYEIGLTVRKAISLAGGFTEKAMKSKITLTRIVDGKEVTLPVEIDDVVQVEDIITVGRSFF
jgi:protein involved in polysaccharide export with SLBB domain